MTIKQYFIYLKLKNNEQHQRRKIRRATGKIVQMNTVTCPLGHKARPTPIGYFCPKCQEWGTMSKEEIELTENMNQEEYAAHLNEQRKKFNDWNIVRMNNRNNSQM